MPGPVKFRCSSKVRGRPILRLRLETLEDRLPPGSLLSGLVLGPSWLAPYLSGLEPEASAAEVALTAGPSTNPAPAHAAQWLEQEAAPVPAAAVSPLVPLSAQGGESQGGHAGSLPASAAAAGDLGNLAFPLPQANAFPATHRSGLPAPTGAAGGSSASAGATGWPLAPAPVQAAGAISEATPTGAQGAGILSPGGLSAGADSAQLNLGSAAAPVRPAEGAAPLSFDPATGQLTIRADMRDHVVAEGVAPNGFMQVTLGSQRHDSDPASIFFDRGLAGASATTVSMIREGGDGGHSTLNLASQALPGRLTVQAEGPVTVTGEVAAGGALAITAPAITVSGTLHGATASLTAAGGVHVQPGAVLGATDGGQVQIAANEIDNDGQIRADGAAGGQVHITAGTVRNAGRIEADGLVGNGGTVWIGYTKSYTDTAQAVVSADGGRAGGGGMLTIVGASSGWLSSRAIPEAVAAPGSHVVDAGALQATGLQGGTITVTGDEVTLASTATADVSGAEGGGSIKFGGDFHGQGSTPTATRTYVSQGATIRADALQRGKGGNVAIWSDDQTWYYGSIFARGGAALGDGGRLEVSGKQDLQYNGQADAAAVRGQNGTLLLDPYDINVVDNGETNDLNDVNNFDRPNLHGDPDPHNPGGTDISVSAINAATGTDVSLFANHDINVNTAIHVTNAGTNLNLFAMHDINIYSPITVSTANMLLSADYSQIGNGGAIRIAPGADLTIAYTTGNKGIFLGADQYDLQAALSPGGGSVTLTRSTSANIYLNSTITNDGTNTLYVSQNVMASITTSTLFVGGDGHYGDINLVADLDVSGVGTGNYNLNFKTVGNITTFDGTVYHNIALGNKSIDFENNATGTGDISTGSITGTGQQTSPAIFQSRGGVYFNGDFAVPGSDLNVTSSNFYAPGQLNVGLGDLINLVPAATVVLMTIGGPGGTGSYEVTDNELANMTANAVFIGISYQLGLDAVLGNNIVGWPYPLFAGGDTLYEMGYTVDNNVMLSFNNIVP